MTLAGEYLERDLLLSRNLAVEIGSALTAPEQRDDLDVVLSRSVPLLEWLLDGPGDDNDRRARRDAVRRHASNLADALTAGTGASRDAGDFIAAAERIYRALTGSLEAWR